MLGILYMVLTPSLASGNGLQFREEKHSKGLCYTVPTGMTVLI